MKHRIVAALVIVGGLFAMHGLAAHGTNGSDHVAAFGMSSAMEADDSPRSIAANASMSMPPDMPGSMSVMELCLVILVGLVVGFAAAAGCRLLRTRSLRRAATTVGWARASARHRSPPVSLIALSIHRC